MMKKNKDAQMMKKNKDAQMIKKNKDAQMMKKNKDAHKRDIHVTWNSIIKEESQNSSNKHMG